MKYFIVYFLFTGMLFYGCKPAHKTTSVNHGDTWFSSGIWKNGLVLKPYDGTNKEEFYRQYYAAQTTWDKVFNFLATHNLDTLSVGTISIDGDNAFIKVTKVKGKPFDSTQWESHRNYIDLQYVISNKEKVLVADTSKLTVTSSYNKEKDAQNYIGEGKEYIMQPGTFYLFFPKDAHRPVIAVNDGYIKKLVVKIKCVK